MLKFKVKDKPKFLMKNGFTGLQFQVIQIEPEYKEIADFTGMNSISNPFMNTSIAEALAHDYCSFLNEKYIDKNINEEWGKIDINARIKYHFEQIRKLQDKRELRWNSDGNGVV